MELKTSLGIMNIFIFNEAKNGLILRSRNKAVRKVNLQVKLLKIMGCMYKLIAVQKN